MEFLSTHLLDAFPDAIFIVRENRVVFCNHTAAATIPDLTLNAPPPEDLALCLASSNTVSAFLLNGVSYTLSASLTEEGQLVILRRTNPINSIHIPDLLDYLRVQMNNLMAASQLLAPTVQSLNSSRYTDYLSVINQSVYRLLQTTSNTEMLYSLERDPSQLYRPVSLDLAALWSEATQQAIPLAKQANVALSYQSKIPCLPFYGDRSLLLSLLLALLSNSLKAAGSGGWVSVTLDRSGNRATLSLKDSGNTADPLDLTALFDPYVKACPQPSDGVGLGILLARRITTLHNGTLIATTEPDGGLRITVSLLIVRSSEDPTFRSPRPDADGGFSPILIGLADALPAESFAPLDVE